MTIDREALQAEDFHSATVRFELKMNKYEKFIDEFPFRNGPI